jgi:RNA polymerase sigma factor (sigma-70 family)
MTADQSVGEELAQDAVVRIWEKWAHVRTAADPDAYAYRIATNVAKSWFRRRLAEQRARARIIGEWRHTTPSPDDHMNADVLRAIKRLPTRQRTAIVLRHYADLSVPSIAEVMGCSLGTAKTHLHRAAAALRESLARRDDKEPDNG